MKTKFQIGYKSIFFYTILFSVFLSCKKYLEVKSDKKLFIPSTLQDLQSILDNYQTLNKGGHEILVSSGDELYYLPGTWSNLYVDDRNNFIWKEDATHIEAWSALYSPVYYANTVLKYLSTIAVNDDNFRDYYNIKGQALVHRALAFYHIAQLYCKPFSTSTRDELGIPIRLLPDIEEASVRSTVGDTYEQIIKDLKEAADYLPDTSLSLNYFVTRPNKKVAFAALARTFLSMRDYSNSGKYADSCLKKYDVLVDYNAINIGSTFSRSNNPEIIFLDYMIGRGTVSVSKALIDSTLYQLYDENDLRKEMFFKQNNNGFGFKGSYSGNLLFCGLATDEMLLIRAECSARDGNKDSALNDLNRLLINRWNDAVPYQNITASNSVEALQKVLIERRKELVFRGLRWSDIRRFNLEGGNITLNRILNGINYELPPNDPRWVLLIPLEVISLSGMEQNPR